MAASLKMFGSRRCSWPECDKEEAADVKLSICAGCIQRKAADPAVYCCREHQAAHWRAPRNCHRDVCKANERAAEDDGTWVDKYRTCMDKSRHFGKLELITWDGIEEEEDGSVEKLGWGAHAAGRGALELNATFQNKYGSSERKFIKYWNNGFRWTCCGVGFKQGMHGCDHHGDPRAPKACTCDFCRGGRPLPQGMFRRKLNSQAAQGLSATLRRGPDPRSLGPTGMINWQMRQLFQGLTGHPDEDDD